MSSSSCNNGAQELTAAVNNSPVDIVILTNGPGKVAAWVKPVVAALWQHTNKHFSDIRILVGTNTAELGSLGIPMLIVLPTHSNLPIPPSLWPFKMFKGAKGGVVGLLAAIPGWIGATVAHSVNLAVLKTPGFISWPNRWAGKEVVPELIGKIEPVEVAAMAADYLKAPASCSACSKGDCQLLASLVQHT
ncbi:unnamed protein product [Sphagnum compactum]